MNLIRGQKLKDGKGELFIPPMYSHKYELRTGARSKANYSWYGWDAKVAGLLTPDDPIAKFSREYYREIMTQSENNNLLGAPSSGNTELVEGDGE